MYIKYISILMPLRRRSAAAMMVVSTTTKVGPISRQKHGPTSLASTACTPRRHVLRRTRLHTSQARTISYRRLPGWLLRAAARYLRLVVLWRRRG